MRPTVLPRQSYLSVVAVFTLLLGAIFDLVVGSPGDAAVLLSAFVASGIGVLILWTGMLLVPRVTRFLPSAWSDRLVAFGLFTFTAAAVFAKITEDVVENESPHFDRAASLLVHQFDPATLDTIMRGLTSLGTLSVIVCVAAAVLVWCWRKRDTAAFSGLVGIIVLDETLKPLLKNIFDRPRPTLFEKIPALDTYSFPSGHAMAAVAMYGMIAVVIARLAPSLKPWAYWGAAFLALLIGYSRVYLGAHWLTDVLAGYAAGTAILGIGLMWLEAYPVRNGAHRVPQSHS